MPKAGTHQASRAARTSTTTRSRCGSSSSRSCRPACPRRRSGATAREIARAQNGLLLHNAPSLTIEAKAEPAGAGQVDQRSAGRQHGNYLPHLLPVDPTLHWANPPGGTMRTRHAARPSPRHPGPTPARCPIVTHVHGAVGVGDESDGYAEAWYLPDAEATSRPATRRTGTWYDFFAARRLRATAPPGAPASPPSSTRTTTAPRPSGTTTTRWA